MLQKKWGSFKKTPVAIAMFVTLIYGLIVHLFGMVTVFHNYDDIAMLPRGLGTTTVSGRWFLKILEDLSVYCTQSYNLTWMNSLFSLLVLSLAVAFLVSTLKIKSKWAAALIGAAFISFPSVTSLFFFKYTAPAYCWAILMSICAVWLTDRWRFGFLGGIVLLACSLGVYQAYLPLAIALYLIILILNALTKETRFIDILRKSFLFLGTIVAGLITYFIILKVFLKIYHVELLGYQGINNMGQISLKEVPGLVFDATKQFILLPLDGYCNLADNLYLRLAYAVIGLISVALIVYLLFKDKQKPLKIAATFFLCALLPTAINSIVLMKTDTVYTLMVLSFSLLICIPIALCELAEKTNAHSKIISLFRKLTVVLIVPIIFFNSVFANVNYSSIYYTNRQVENAIVSIFTQASQQPGYTADKKWAFIGQADNNSFDTDVWGGTLLYGGNATTISLVNGYSFIQWTHHYLGHNFEKADQSTHAQLQQLPEVQDMPSWPNYGSVKVIGEYVVVKFS